MSSTSNKSDVGGVLQTNHIAIADPGAVTAKLAALHANGAATRMTIDQLRRTDQESEILGWINAVAERLS